MRLLRYPICGVIMLKPLKKKISITLDEDLVDQLRIFAEENDRSLSQFINLILKNYVKNHKNEDYAN